MKLKFVVGAALCIIGYIFMPPMPSLIIGMVFITTGVTLLLEDMK